VEGPALVTGATGFAGSHLIDQLLQSSQAVAAWANPGGRPPSPDADPRVAWDAVDLFDSAAVARALTALKPSAIYHCAGIAHVGDSWSEPVRALRVNALGTQRLLDGVRMAGLTCPVLVTGSAMVYRESAEAIDESHPPGPSSPYAVSKFAQEMAAARASDLSVLIARPFNHAGPRQGQNYVTSSFALQIAEIEAGLRPPVLRVGNLAARRDITDVRDTVRAYRLLVAAGQRHQPYNVCSGNAYRVSDLLDALVGMSTATISIEQDSARMRPSDNPVVLGNHSRLTADTGWVPEIPIEQTLRDILDYWRSETRRPRPAA
jgi:GDP-4-dehydro-6-deoxy-D-mannose reductase